MKKQFYFWILVLIGNNCFAQLSGKKENLKQYDTKQSDTCGGVTEVFKKIGNWKRYPEYDIVFPDKTFPASQYSLLLGRIEKVLPMMKEAVPDLGGFEPQMERFYSWQFFCI